MTSAAGAAAEQSVARLLTAGPDGDIPAAALIAAMPPDDAAVLARRLLEEGERLIGVDPRRMERLCRAALALADRTADRYLRAMARFKLGEACTLQDRNVEGRAHLDEAEALFIEGGYPVEAARTRIIWIWATANLGDERAALRAARRVRRSLRAQRQPRYLGMLEFNVGILHCLRGRLAAGVRRFRAALLLFETAGDVERAERVRQNLGLALSRLGRCVDALAVLEQARESARGGDRIRTYALVSRSLGETYLRLGRYTAALRAFEEARAISESLGLDDGAVTLARDLADCYLRLNRPTDALAALAAIDTTRTAVDTTALLYGLESRRAAAFLLLDRQEEALQALDRMRDLTVPGSDGDRAWLAGRRAALLLERGDAAEALRVARDGAALARRAGLRPLAADLTATEGDALLAVGDIPAALRAARRVRRTGRALDAAPLLHRATEILGRIAESKGRLRAAERCYTDAIAAFEREQRHVIFEHRDRFALSRTRAYERLASLQVKQGRPADALLTAERAKSRALADSISGAIEIRPRGSATARRITRRLTAAREEYAAYYARVSRPDGTAGGPPDAEATATLRRLEARIDDLVLRLQLEATAGEIADIYGAAPAAALPEVPPDTLLIEYFVTSEGILRFVVDGGRVAAGVLPAAVSDVDRLLSVFRLNVAAAATATPERRRSLTEQARAILTQLYRALLDGVAIPPTCRRLLVVPHGLLHYVPFHALFDGRQHLIGRVAVAYAPSAALYGICLGRARRKRPGRPLVLAHSAEGKLGHTLAEAGAVAAVLDGTLRIEEAASRAAIAAEGRRAGLIHIAAHGEFRPDAPLFSHVQLADGPLTTADVFNLDLRAGLVTLSACETGRSQIGGGDELVGLSRAFLYAGAAALLVSQWRVDDASTATLMTAFYRALRAGVSPAESLRRAQCAMVEGGVPQDQLSHPFYWAAFQLIGAG